MLCLFVFVCMLYDCLVLYVGLFALKYIVLCRVLFVLLLLSFVVFLCVLCGSCVFVLLLFVVACLFVL